MRQSVILALIPLPIATMGAQNPGQNAHIDVSIASISTTGDTTGISYLVTNLVSSTEPLWVFHVDAPSGVLRISESTGTLRWRNRTSSAGQPMAGWTFLRQFLAPGATTPELHFEAVGLPGIRTFWAGGYFPLPEVSDNPVTDSTVLADPFVAQMTNGSIVGVDPWPADRSAQSLLARLRTVTQATCAAPSYWISDATLCGQLVSDLDQAEGYRSSGHLIEAKDALDHYKGRISGGSSSGAVKNPAYWLLNVNADVIGAMWQS
jgi:hypothetical protein